MVAHKKMTEKDAEELADGINADLKIFAYQKHGAFPLNDITFQGETKKGKRLYKLKHMSNYIYVEKGRVRSMSKDEVD